jgi:type IV secretion system protein TrbE
MFIQAEARKNANGLSDLIDYFALADDGVLLLSTNVLVAAWEFWGPDMDALPIEECWQIAKRMSSKLRMGKGWTIHCDLIRSQKSEYSPSADWPDAVSHMIDHERRNRYMLADESGTRLSRYFMAVSYEAGAGGSAKAARFLFDATQGGGSDEKDLAVFGKKVSEIDSLLRANLPGVRRLKSYEKRVGEATMVCDELLEYVRWCICGEEFPFAIPDVPAHLNQYLAADDFTGGGEPELGDPMNELVPGKRICVIAIDGFPQLSFAGIMRELDSIPYDFRFCQQGALMDAQEATKAHEANKGKWKSKKTSIKSKLMQNASPELADTVAAELEGDALRAMNLAEHGREVSVRYSGKVVVMESSVERLRQAVQAITRVIRQNCGFSCRIETTNAVAAWLATFPGQQYKDPRTFIVTTENLVHMMPLSAPFRGLEFCPSPYFPYKSPPLFHAVTSGGSAYRFHPLVKDVGHQLITGPTGSGKTTWLGLSIAQWFRYPGAQVYAFDKKRALYTLTKAMGGDFIDISPDSGETLLCPLAQLETKRDLDWASQWIELLLDQNGLTVTPDIRNDVAEALQLLAGSKGGRSLTDFRMAVASIEVKEALKFYCGGILDGEKDNLELSRMVVFEMDELYRLDKKTMNGALFYIFHKIRKRLRSDVPTLVTVDEFREALSHPMAAKCFEEFLLEGRKLNMSVWLVLQELSKVFASPLKSAVLDQCLTKVCLPNPQAILEGASAYEAMGCNSLDREKIAHAEPKSDYYVMSPDGKRLIALELGALTLSFVAASTDADRARVDNMIARNGHGWVATWLRSRGLNEWADYYSQISNLAEKETAQYA